MIRRFLANHIALPLQDLVNHTSVLKTRDHLLKSQYWPAEKMEEYQLKKVRALVAHAGKNVKYYRDLFTKEDIHVEDIRSLEDFRKIPVLTKETALREHKNLIADNIRRGHVTHGSTGGTTGTPLPLLWDSGDRSFSWGAYYRWYNWMGLTPGDSMAKLWGAKKVLEDSASARLRNTLKDYYYNRTTLNSFNLNKQTVFRYIDKLNSFKPKFVRGYLSALMELSRLIEKEEITLSFIPKALSTTTETVLPVYRKYLREIWQAELFDQYGCGECNSMAFECSAHDGMHIASEHVYLEKPEDHHNESVPVILTNLDNYAMPFIRYMNGDEVVFADKMCSCGVKLPMINQVTGRAADYIILADNSKVHGVFFTDILNELPDFNISYAKRFQVVQDKPGTIQFLMEADETPPKEFIENLKKAFSRFFTHSEIIIKGKLQSEPSGKFRYIKNNIVQE